MPSKLVTICVFLCARHVGAGCSNPDGSRCICLNDNQCTLKREALYFTASCPCQNGKDLSLSELAEILKGLNGTVDALFVRGWKIQSLNVISDKLEEVRQSLIFVSTSLQSLRLRSLRKAGSLVIAANAHLSHIRGLRKLSTVANDITIIFNDMLHEFNGPRQLKSIGGNLEIGCNHHLFCVGGFRKLASVGGDLIISSNVRLKEVTGFEALESVSHGLRIANNDKLHSLGGMTRLTSAGGTVKIVGNFKLEDVRGLQKLALVGLDLIIRDNANLRLENPHESGLEQLEVVGRDVRVSRNKEINCRNMLSGLAWVGRHLMLSHIRSCDVDLLANLRRVGGNIDIRKSIFRWRQLLCSVSEIGGSLEIVSNRFKGDNQHILGNLSDVCTYRDSNRPCGLKIKNNRGLRSISGFQNLGGFNGTLSITGNAGLQTVKAFHQLEYLSQSSHDRRHLYGETEDVTGGMVIAFNADLTSVVGFDALETVVGDVFLIGNPMLDRVILQSLHTITGWTRFASNSANAVEFTSPDPLPYLAPGCRIRKNIIPSIGRISENGTAFATMLNRSECRIEKLIPALTGAVIIFAMAAMSLMLSIYTLGAQNGAPSQRRPVKYKQPVDKLAVSILAMADLFSDTGFSVTAFIMWQAQAPNEWHSPLFIIFLLSALVLVMSQGYTVVSVYIGLTAAKWGYKRSPDGSRISLLRGLIESGEMQLSDWLLLFPGLFLLEAGVIRYLPWDRRSLEGKSCEPSGFPHEHFSRVAFRASVIEDLPQIILQSAFVVLVEGDDGWAITAAMGSMTISVADLVVKLIVPVLNDYFRAKEGGAHKAGSDQTKF